MKTKTQILLKEPLLHFLVIGTLLFVIYGWMNESVTQSDKQIVITPNDLQNLATTWLKRMGRPPSDLEREHQLKQFIREQVLSREAVIMGLDQGDVIIRRRLAQKMEFLFDDLSVVPDPTENELADYLSNHAEIFVRPATLSFSQIYFEPGEHKEDVKELANKLLEKLRVENIKNDAFEKGDRSLLPYEFHNERQSQIKTMFGEKFTQQVFSLPLNNWHGPVVSEYGVHLIYVSSRSKKFLPTLYEIRKSVVARWQSSKQKKANDIFYKSLYQRYEIVLDEKILKSFHW